MYAPVALSGVTISFEIDFQKADGSKGPPITQINLTPRLVAKLLTDSYWQANPYRLGGTNNLTGGGTPPASHYAWLAKNPANLFADPDFQRYNPQFKGIDDAATAGFPVGSVMVELTGSDAAYELWSWILADPSAKSFLAGRPDPWGMTVDPYFSTSQKVNPAHAGLILPTNTFPSPDSWSGYTQIPPASGQPPITITGYRPYTDSMAAGAQDVLEDNPLQKLDWDTFDPPPTHYKSDYSIPVPGTRDIMGVTSTDSADRYGILDASLLNAGGKFVTPNTAGLLAGAAAMRPSGFFASWRRTSRRPPRPPIRWPC